jgi:hypothetical protein
VPKFCCPCRVRQLKGLLTGDDKEPEKMITKIVVEKYV